jgi:hypothetical protein
MIGECYGRLLSANFCLLCPTMYSVSAQHGSTHNYLVTEEDFPCLQGNELWTRLCLVGDWVSAISVPHKGNTRVW